MEDTWMSRDLPILESIVELFEQGDDVVSPSQVAGRSGNDLQTTQRALRALASEDPPLIAEMGRTSSGQIFMVGAPTGAARRAVGAWPTAETIADRLIQALDEAAEREPNVERKGYLRKAAGYLGNTGRDLAVEIGATAINRQMGN